ncbi:MAG: GPW/gp25 family protein [Saprospiraceae bacterium]
MSKKSFLGTGWGFPISFDDHEKSVKMVSEEEDIRQSLFILLSTRPGERIVNPLFGCRIHDYLFEPLNSATLLMIEDAVRLSVLYYEPRIDLEEVDIDTSEELEGKISISLTYKVRRINMRTNIVYPFYKLEGTNIVEEI